jgi:hypothetical protein
MPTGTRFGRHFRAVLGCRRSGDFIEVNRTQAGGINEAGQVLSRIPSER